MTASPHQRVDDLFRAIHADSPEECELLIDCLDHYDEWGKPREAPLIRWRKRSDHGPSGDEERVLTRAVGH